LLRAIDGACTAGAVLAAVSAGLLALILIAEVAATSFLGWSQPWSVEYAIYLQCFVLFLGAGWTLRQGGHIRVAVLLGALPQGLARLLDLLGSAFAIGIVGFATLALWGQLLRTFEFGSTSFYPMGTPLWIPQGLLTVGVTLLWLAFAARLIRLLLRETPEISTGLGGGGVE
jgi:TRAP-type C4-dicarboxylate transport system permease small subunit